MTNMESNTRENKKKEGNENNARAILSEYAVFRLLRKQGHQVCWLRIDLSGDSRALNKKGILSYLEDYPEASKLLSLLEEIDNNKPSRLPDFMIINNTTGDPWFYEVKSEIKTKFESFL